MKKQIRFTRKSIDALPACPQDSASREVEYSDLDVTGLRLIINKKGRKSFLFRYVSPDGRKRSMGIGGYPETDIAEAREKAIDYRRQLAKGIDPQDVRDEVEATKLTFRDFIERDYLPHARASIRSWADTEARLRIHLLPEFGNKLLTEIKNQDVQRFHDRMRQKLCPASANRILAVLKRTLNLAILWEKGGLVRNPVIGVRMHQENNQRQRYLNNDELARFLDALDSEPNRVAADLFALLLATGVRSGNAMAAKWEHIRLDDEYPNWFLPTSKNGMSQTIYLNPVAVEVLKRRERIPGNPYVFPSDRVDGAPINNPAKAFKRVLDRAGIKDFRIHDCRHQAASMAINSGASLFEVKSLLTHRNVATSARYSHLSDESLRRTSDKVADVLTKARLRPAQAA